MLTPGIEYFGARSDGDAVLFGEGNHASVSGVVRADGLAPDGAFAFLGALMTARPLADLVDPDELVTLSTEPRDEITITVLRLPTSVGTALAGSTNESIAELARRARVSWGYPTEIDTEMSELLSEIGAAVRSGGGHLYARVLAPTTPAPLRIPMWSHIMRAAPILGLISVPALLVAAGAAVVLDAVPWLPFVPFFGAVIMVRVSIATIRRRRAAMRAIDVLDGAAGITFPIIAEPGFLSGLWDFQREVLNEEPMRPRDGIHGQLVVDPSGIRVHLGESSTFIGAGSVRGLASVATRVDVESFAAVGEIAALAIILTVDDDESISWVAPLASEGHEAFRVDGSEGFATYASALLGVPDLTSRTPAPGPESNSEGESSE